MIVSMIFEFSVPDYIILNYLQTYTSFGPGTVNEKSVWHTITKTNIHVGLHVFANSGFMKK